jgi:glycosyltransferase involved in cell wall biosynthesis
MRILMAVPKYPPPIVGGLERQAYELAKALTRREHVIDVLSSRFDHRQKYIEMVDGIRVHRVQWVNYKLIRFLLFPFRLARVLYKLKRNVDVVHVHNLSWFGTFVTLFAKALHLPVITKLPNIGKFGIPGMRRGLIGFLHVALLKKSDSIIAMTPESVAELVNIGYSLSRVLNVTNGIPLLTANLVTSRPHSPDATTAIFVGRISPQKGVIDLIHAWATVKAHVTRPVKLRIIGDGPQGKDLKALVVSLGLSETVELVGYCEDVPAELAKADLFVLPSYEEGNSNAILEAMRAGLPIIATCVGGSPIQVGREGERFLVPTGNCQVLADRMLELIEDEALRFRLGSAMRARIESLFAIDRIAAIYEQAYELILSGRCEQIGQINPGLFSQDETEDR